MDNILPIMSHTRIEIYTKSYGTAVGVGLELENDIQGICHVS